MHVTKETFMPNLKGNPHNLHSLIITRPPTLKIGIILANSAYPEEIPPYAVFY